MNSFLFWEEILRRIRNFADIIEEEIGTVIELYSRLLRNMFKVGKVVVLATQFHEEPRQTDGNI